MRGKERGQERGDAFDLVGLPSSAYRQPSSHYWLTDTRPDRAPLRINTEVSGVRPANQRKMSVEAVPRSNLSVLSPTRYDSPVCRIGCDGWCGTDLVPRANVVGGHSVLIERR